MEKMDLKLLRANREDAKELHAMQVKAFGELFAKYQDFDTNSANESMGNVELCLYK